MGRALSIRHLLLDDQRRMVFRPCDSRWSRLTKLCQRSFVIGQFSGSARNECPLHYPQNNPARKFDGLQL